MGRMSKYKKNKMNKMLLSDEYWTDDELNVIRVARDLNVKVDVVLYHVNPSYREQHDKSIEKYRYGDKGIATIAETREIVNVKRNHLYINCFSMKATMRHLKNYRGYVIRTLNEWGIETG